MQHLAIILKIFIFFKIVTLITASAGDRSQFFINCQHYCIAANCTQDGIDFKPDSETSSQQSVFDKLMFWSCTDECRDMCMWRTVRAFIDREWPIPQFFGKWPFVRFLGLQEPASVLFSLMNFGVHIHQLKKFRRLVRSDSPCYRLWHLFAFICLNGWTWSTIFHARDFVWTELLDYASAYSIVLGNFYCMAMRVLYKKSIILRATVSTLCLSFYINYFMYLSMGPFDYSFNMRTNIVTGIMAGIGWIFWFTLVRKKRQYASKIVVFNMLLAATLALEVRDFPPIFWVFDAHSLWHLSSVPLVFIFYSFIIDDCKALRKEKANDMKKE